ncbi:putative viral capsid [Circoviridae TaCV2]|uniref:Putative viral capsid n=1 Tax=Circoviridae TaCV2 TaxID=2094725 RepID=A0A2L2P5L0_9VIRU|nr:putative viral capsid [Circoviridae TaCV2]
MASPIDKVRRYKKLTSTFLPENTTEIKEILKKEYAMDYLKKALNIQERTTKTRYCRDHKISVHTLNQGLKALNVNCNKQHNRNKNKEPEHQTTKSKRTQKSKNTHVHNDYAAGSKTEMHETSQYSIKENDETQTEIDNTDLDIDIKELAKKITKKSKREIQQPIDWSNREPGKL